MAPTASITPRLAPPAAPTTPARRRVGPDCAGLLVLARHGVVEAALSGDAAQRYATAHLAALRAAAAVVAAKARPEATARRRPVSVWTLLEQVAPELGEWAAFFAAGARKRAAAEAGLPGHVTTRDADDLLRDAETFLAVVETTLGIDVQQALQLGRPGGDGGPGARSATGAATRGATRPRAAGSELPSRAPTPRSGRGTA